MPGYVFFDAQDEPDWDLIRRFSGVLKTLHYEDGARALRAEDLAFVKWLKRYEGMVDVSQVIKVGTKIAFVSGPLVGMEARVLKVNQVSSRMSFLMASCSLVYSASNVSSTLW